MGKKDLSLKPHQVAKTEECDAWWYEENGGINIHVQHHCNIYENNHCSLTIPWRAIRAALARKDK